MTTYTEVLPVRKSSKRSAVQWVAATDDAASPLAGVLQIDTDRARVRYAVSEFPADWPGRAFHLAKLTAGTDPESERYSVFCSARGPAGDQCECKGFSFKGHCKHLDAARALLANGWL